MPYLLHASTYDYQNRLTHMRSPVRHRPDVLVGANNRRVMHARPLLVDDLWFEASIEDIRTKVREGRLRVTTPDGRAVDVMTMAIGPGPVISAPPEYIPPSIKTMQAPADYVPPYPGSVPLPDDVPIPINDIETVQKPPEVPLETPVPLPDRTSPEELVEEKFTPEQATAPATPAAKLNIPLLPTPPQNKKNKRR